MIAVKYNEPVQYNKELHISDGSIKKKIKVRNNCTQKQATWDF